MTEQSTLLRMDTDGLQTSMDACHWTAADMDGISVYAAEHGSQNVPICTSLLMTSQHRN